MGSFGRRMTRESSGPPIRTRRSLRALLVEDSEDDATLVLHELHKGGFDIVYRRVETERDLEAALAEPWDVVISSFQVPGLTGQRALRVLKARAPEVPFVLVSGTVGEETAVEMLVAGVSDCVLKNRLARLPSAVERVLDETEQRREHRRAEEQLRHAQKMEAVGRLASGVAHDFNNVLTAILGYAELALLKIGDTPEAKADLEEILRAGERAVGLTRQLLAFGGNKGIASPRPLRLTDVITDLDKMLRRLIGEQIRMKTVLEEDAGDVRADRGQIEQVLVNLVINARDAMPEGGTITIGVANVDLDASRRHELDLAPGPYVMLFVADTS